MKGHNQCAWLKVGELDIGGKKAAAVCFARLTSPDFAKAAQLPFPASLAEGGGGGGGFRVRYIAAGMRER